MPSYCFYVEWKDVEPLFYKMLSFLRKRGYDPRIAPFAPFFEVSTDRPMSKKDLEDFVRFVKEIYKQLLNVPWNIKVKRY